MDKNQLEKCRLPLPETLKNIFFQREEDDEHGHYATGLFRYKGKNVFVNIEEGKWHLSADARRTLGYYEFKELRYQFLPNHLSVAQIFPPREEFVNVNENCFHLYEIDADGEMEAAADSIVAFRLGVERAVNALKSAVDNPKNADVQIMCEQLAIIYGKEKVRQERLRKLMRLHKRIQSL